MERSQALLRAADEETKAAAKAASESPGAVSRLRRAANDLERARRLSDLQQTVDDEVFWAASGWFINWGEEDDLESLDTIRFSGRISRWRESLLNRVTDSIRSRLCGGEVTRAIQRLLGRSSDTEQAAVRLHELGVAIRGSILPRGTLFNAAGGRIANETLRQIGALLTRYDGTMRSRIAMALGEWGGAESVEPLQTIALSEGETRAMRQYAISALRTLGGPEAARTLMSIAAAPVEDLRLTALDALEELVTGGRGDYSVEPRPASQPKFEAGIVREIEHDLSRLISSRPRSDLARQKAMEILAYVQRARLAGNAAAGSGAAS